MNLQNSGVQLLASLGYASTSLTDEPALLFEGNRLSVRWKFDREGEEVQDGLRFGGVTGFRSGAERHSTTWHLKAHDKVVEIEPSSWVEEVRAIEKSRSSWGTELRHFMVYLDSWGYLEVLGVSWSMLDERLPDNSPIERS